MQFNFKQSTQWRECKKERIVCTRIILMAGILCLSVFYGIAMQTKLSLKCIFYRVVYLLNLFALFLSLNKYENNIFCRFFSFPKWRIIQFYCSLSNRNCNWHILEQLAWFFSICQNFIIWNWFANIWVYFSALFQQAIFCSLKNVYKRKSISLAC